MKDSVRPTRTGNVLKTIFACVVVLVLLGVGALMFAAWFFADADSSADGHTVAFLMGLALWGMAALAVYRWRRSSREWPRAVAERIGVPDSLQHLDNARPVRNTPNALRGNSPPKSAMIVAGRSIWFSRVTILVILAIGMGLLYLGSNIARTFPQWHVSGSYLLLGFGALLLVIGLVGLWPSNWRKRFLGFIAVREGIYVHGQGVYPDGHERAAPETLWLFVPWANVVDVRKGLVFKGGGQGGAQWWPSTKLSLRVTPDEAREWFPYADDEPSDDGMSRVVSVDYSDSDPSPSETVPRLQKLWAPE
ncbi:hypothetical protein RM531_01015 [Salinisphaera sp. P385]|uniref:DUF3592 domain-containing protein n=1 Tax=Spectribacter acetivorans TaxID=3075603 RepID=A0ABU3B4Q4_9GAMM|nr:hypothetical protein [Salinisphaera sp. P385]MDT0617045.1 hypothetical protein [Salinisphaera sp. P385]